MKCADDLYAYLWEDPYENNCNSYYLGGSVQALVDPGLAAHLPRLLTRLEEDGIAREQIRYILNTHAHPDHLEGSICFRGTDVRIGLHPVEEAFLRGEGAPLYDWFGLPRPELTIDLPCAEGPLALGVETLEVLHCPGHSPGSVALFWRDRGALIAGDVIFRQSLGRTDFPGGDGEKLKASIGRLAALEASLLLPGHMDWIEGRQAVRKNFQTVADAFFAYI